MRKAVLLLRSRRWSGCWRCCKRYITGSRSRSFGLLLVGDAGLVAGGGGFLFLVLRSVTSQAQRTSLDLPVGNLGCVRRGGSHRVYVRTFCLLGLLFDLLLLGTSRQTGLLRRLVADLQRIYRLVCCGLHSACVFSFDHRSAGQRLGGCL